MVCLKERRQLGTGRTEMAAGPSAGTTSPTKIPILFRRSCSTTPIRSSRTTELVHNDKKENKIFLIFKEIQKGAVVQSDI